MIERLRHALTHVSFTRGLAWGALVGAAIAGSTLWSRLRGGGRDAGVKPLPDPRRRDGESR